MPAIADTDVAKNGGSPIQSYSLEWDEGFSQGGFTAVTGAESNNLVLSHTRTGLTAGATYRFRYRVRNTYGWSK
jgi:hypothetical protein